MKKLILLAAVLGAAALPSVAGADKYPDVVSIHSDDQFNAEEIYGSVESAKGKCEKNRTIKLFHDDFDSKRGGSFQQVDETTTDGFGQYSFSPGGPGLRGNGSFDDGDYFARVTKKLAGNDVCRRDDSRIIEVFQSCQETQEKQAAAARRGIFC